MRRRFARVLLAAVLAAGLLPGLLLGGCEKREIRFVALGDMGTGGKGQSLVAEAMVAKCARDGCDFGLLLGDLIYPSGVESAGDPLFQSHLADPYAALDIPFYVTLGNHDYARKKSPQVGMGSLFRRRKKRGPPDDGFRPEKGGYYLGYFERHSKWIMPALYYTFQRGPATFLALDTYLIKRNHDGAVRRQGEFASRVLADKKRPWTIVFGHHPYISNTLDGSAADSLKAFYERYLCGGIDVFLAGHDHNLQILQAPPPCPGSFVISGGGGRRLNRLLNTHRAHFQKRTLGFAYFHVTPGRITVELIDGEGRLLYTRQIAKP